jgi:hypothetical protein
LRLKELNLFVPPTDSSCELVQRLVRDMAIRFQAEQLELVQVVVDAVLHRPHGRVHDPQLFGPELGLMRPLAGDHPTLPQSRADELGPTKESRMSMMRLTALLLLAGTLSLSAQTSPAPRVIVSPGEDLAAAVARAPSGATFVFKPGVYRRQSITPRSHDTFIGEPGAILDGEHVTGYAFETLASTPSAVTIRGLVIEHYVPALNLGAIQADNGADWVVEDNEIRFNANIGLKVGPRMRVRRNHVHHNGVSGINGYRSHGVVVEQNEVAYNNPSNTFVDPSLAGESGLKFVELGDLVVRDNSVHHNNGIGIWCDTARLNMLIEGNTVSLNTTGGIWQELGYSAIIRHNIVTKNGLAFPVPDWLQKAGIAVTNSSDVEVYGNILAGNANGVTAMQASGYPTTGPHGPKVLRNLYVHDNLIAMPIGRTGLAQNVGDLSYFRSRNNRWVRNLYQLGAGSSPFAWMNRSLSSRQWQGAGQDREGAFVAVKEPGK